MRAFLQVTKGPGLGRKITLREGQLRYVGRTDSADVSCPENPEMSSVHFSIQWLGNECQFKDLNSANGSFRNGERVAESLVYNGDELRAGQAVFRVVIGDEAEVGPAPIPEPGKGPTPDFLTTHKSLPVQFAEPEHKHEHPPAPVAPAPAGMPSAEGSVGLLIASATEIAGVAPIDGDNAKLASRDQNTLQFVEMLANHEKFMDAIRVLAFAMGKLTVIEWSLKCVKLAVEDGMSKVDTKALDTVQRWLGDRTEGLRREAYAVSQEAEHATPASWVAMAAFWSEGSMGPPPPAPPLAPGPTQCAHAATGAILLAAVARQPEKAPDRYREFIRIGMEMVGGNQ